MVRTLAREQADRDGEFVVGGYLQRRRNDAVVGVRGRGGAEDGSGSHGGEEA